MLFGTDISPQRLRGRIKALLHLYEQEPKAIDGKRNHGKAYLRNGANGYKTDEIEHHTAIYAQGESNEPLTFTEICSFNTWFVMHPEKVAGEEKLTTSLHFPVTIKGNREDIDSVLDNREIWQMQREEIESSLIVFPVEHKEIIVKALSEGKPVPEKVLNDYPELKTKEREQSMPEKNLMLYTKLKKEKNFKATNTEGYQVKNLMYASIIPAHKFEEFKKHIIATAKANPDVDFQIREAGTQKVWYDSRNDKDQDQAAKLRLRAKAMKTKLELLKL